MAFDLSFLLGLDDSEFRSKMRESESAVSRTAGRLGDSIKSQTGGLQKLASSITGAIGAFTGILGVATLIAGAAYGIYRVVDDWASAGERAAEAARKELERRKEIRDTIDAELLASRAGAGMVSKDLVSESAARRSFEQLRERLQEETKYNELLLERQQILEAEYKAEQDALQSVYGAGASGGGERPINERLAEIEPLLAAHEDRLLEIAAAEREVLAHIQAQAEARADAIEAQARMNLLTLAGNILAADQLKETLRHEEQLRKIDEIALQSAERAQQLRDLENDVHSNRMRQIEEEETARRDAEAEQAKRAEEQAQRERERAENLQFNNEMLAEQQKLEKLRLTGQDEAAKALEMELEHRRNIREIEQREGVDDAERARLRRAEEDLYALRQQQVTNTAAASRAPSSIGFGGGFSDPLLSRQVLGVQRDDPQRAIKSNTDKILDRFREAVEELREIKRNFTIGLV